MGAWGTGTFDNDDAADWVWELEEAGDYEVTRAVLEAVTQRDDYLEAPTCSEALAAAEVLAAGRGRPPVRLPDEVAAWLAGREAPDDALVALAKRAVAVIARDSELRELWAEGEHFSQWQAALFDLDARLS